MKKSDLNSMCIYSMCILLMLLTPFSLFSEEKKDGGEIDAAWDAAVKTIEAENRKSLNDAARTGEIIALSRQALKKERRELDESLKKADARLSDLQDTFEALLDEEEKLRLKIDEENEDLKAVAGTVRTSARQAWGFVKESHTTPERPDRNELINSILDTNEFPGIDKISSLSDLFFEEMTAGGRIEKREGKYIGPDGRTAEGEILRAGNFSSYYKDADGNVGFLLPDSSGKHYAAVQAHPDRRVRKSITAFFSGESDHLPLDISGGAVFQLLVRQKDLREWIRSGGILVWPIIFAGIAAFLIGAERLVTLGRIKVSTDTEMASVREMAEKGEWEKCREFCNAQSAVPTLRVLGHAVPQRGASREAIENTIQEAMLKELPRLEKFLPTLGVLAAVAPLLGLLGTVTGMINTFQVISSFGTGDPRMMSGGISEALVTTQLGLAVAVPVMVLHHFLERKVDRVIGDMEEKGTAFAVALMTENT